MWYHQKVPLLARAFISFAALPCIFAGLIPSILARMDQPRFTGSYAALVPIIIGLLILLGAVRDFFVFGRGTLAPWDPPKRLVVAGLYRFVRNPMYVGITLFLLGWSWFSGSTSLLAYSFALLVAFHLRILLYEEPILRKSFPSDWPVYSRAVPRWTPRLKPWIPITL